MKAFLLQFWRLGMRRSVRAALFGATLAAVGIALFWGFTVDDAFISARVAHQIATGHGYRFNPSGPAVDAVTPLGWSYVLAPFAYRDPLDAFLAARWIGVAAWLASAAWLAASVVRRGGAAWPMALVVLSAPLGLWASAGMETAVVTALVTFGTARGTWGLGSAGAAAALRPELIPFAFTLALGRAASLRELPRNLLVTVGPAIFVASIRWMSFGTPHPLAVVAKPSSPEQGLWYALEALLWSGPIWLWMAPGWPWLGLGQDGRSRWPQRLARRIGGLPGLPRLERPEAVLALAILVHFVAIALAGGDWMPAYRLAVPIMPAMLRVAGHVAIRRGRWLNLVAVALAAASCAYIAVKLAPRARRIADQRARLIQEGAASLRSATVVAAPDVGWVGMAFSGEIVDLAGATDSSIAYLRGGHTSKRVELRHFITRKVDHVVVLLSPQSSPKHPFTDSTFARWIDRRAAMLAAELGCVPAFVLPLAYTSQSYLVLRCPAP